MPSWRSILLISLPKIDNLLPATQPAIYNPVQRAPVDHRLPLLGSGACGDVDEVFTRLWVVGFSAPFVARKELLNGRDPNAEFFHVHGHG